MDACLAVASERDQRRYVERPVSEDGVSWILDAGGIAGRAKNGQPWRFLVLGNRGTAQNMMLAAGNEGCPNGIASPDSLGGPFGTRGG